MENNKITVIIPTMQKDVDNLNILIGLLEKDESISEIIVINNCKNPFETNFSKVRVINSGKNLYVNPSWNLGIAEAKTEYYALFNDDVLVCKDFCSKVLDKITEKEDFGVLGMGEGTVINTSDKTIPNPLEFRVLRNEEYERPYNWGVIIFGKKSAFEPIPQELKIMCGDDFLRHTVSKKNLKIYDLMNADISHLGSVTSNCSRKIIEMGQLDMLKYGEIDENFKNTIPYNWAKKELSLKVRLQRMGKTIFSLVNSNDRKHKIITFCGIKFSIKKSFKLKDKLRYYEYIENYENFSNKDFVPITQASYNCANTVKPIAFYLPQFHTIPLNDRNFGKGFTEWTNVTRAIPQFAGHYQPHIPYDVGFYDLSKADVMYRQVELAKMYGIYGFCFHYYWFSGQRLLEKPIFNYLENKDLNLPFCLCWANENWSTLWDGGNREIIMEQNLKSDDDEKFFRDILPFFKDERYIKIDNKPLLIIYRLNLFEQERIVMFIEKIKKLAQEEGFGGIHVVGANAANCKPIEYGADATVEFPPHCIDRINKKMDYVNNNFSGCIIDMESYIKNKVSVQKCDTALYKGIFPCWDNTARKARTNAWIFLSSPELYKAWLTDIINWTKQNHKQNDQFVFINAWNEWAEGAHLEPDLKYGYAYLQATKEALEENP